MKLAKPKAASLLRRPVLFSRAAFLLPRCVGRVTRAERLPEQATDLGVVCRQPSEVRADRLKLPRDPRRPTAAPRPAPTAAR
jgi:hypothetical protein